MEKKFNKHIYFSFLLCVAAICILFASCKSEDTAPVITSIRMYDVSSKDTLMSTGNPDTDPSWSGRTGQYVVIIGQNLQDVVGIRFNGVAVNYNSALFSSTTAVVPIPDIVYSTIDTTKLYTVEYATTTGSTIFSFKLGPAAPTITAISDVFANPGDSVYVYGSNLVLVKSFSYGGVPITSFKTSLNGTSLGFLMPNPAPTSGDVLVTAERGTVDFPIVALPTITGISNENASAGDSVYVYGTYLKSIQSFSFGGAPISSYKLSTDGKSIGFVQPSPVQTGPVSITTAFGAATTVYNVNDVKGIGSLTTAEGGDNWQWWGGASLVSGNPTSSWPSYNSGFPGNLTNFFVLNIGKMSPSEGNTWSNYTILLNERQWVPTANIDDPVANYVLKFEVSIPTPWNGASLDIMSADQTYIFRWEPWQISTTTTAAYSTKGWVTITVPFTEFRATDTKLGNGRGLSITKFSDLLGASGKSKCTVYVHNYSTTATTATGFNGAFDNIRVVKIK